MCWWIFTINFGEIEDSGKIIKKNVPSIIGPFTWIAKAKEQMDQLPKEPGFVGSWTIYTHEVTGNKDNYVVFVCGDRLEFFRVELSEGLFCNEKQKAEARKLMAQGFETYFLDIYPATSIWTEPTASVGYVLPTG